MAKRAKQTDMSNVQIFVDTNISIETLKPISDEDHVLIMLADPNISVTRFFERPDREKQFLYRLLLFFSCCSFFFNFWSNYFCSCFS